MASSTPSNLKYNLSMSLLSPHILGVDIGHSSVKVVGISAGKKPAFLGCKEITMDPKYLEKDGFANPILIGQAVREAMRTAAPRPIVATQAYSAVSESLVFRKVLEMPFMEDAEEMKAAIKLEAAQYLPENPEEMVLDYQFFDLLPDKQAKQQIMVVAMPKKILLDYLAVFQAAKLTVKGIGVKPSALGAALVPLSEQKCLIIIDIGSEICTISIYDRHVVRVTAVVNMGATMLRDAKTGELDEEAFTEKSQTLLHAIGEEMEHVIKFYSNRMLGRQEISEVVLTGGGSMLVGILEGVQKLTDLPVSAGRPVVAIPAFCDRRFTGALGCALYPLVDSL